MSGLINQSLDEIIQSTQRRRPTHSGQTRGGVRAAMEQVSDKVSADKGNSLARQGGRGADAREGRGKAVTAGGSRPIVLVTQSSRTRGPEPCSKHRTGPNGPSMFGDIMGFRPTISTHTGQGSVEG